MDWSIEYDIGIFLLTCMSVYDITRCMPTTLDTPPKAATKEPAIPTAAHRPDTPHYPSGAPGQNPLSDDLVEPALDAGRDSRPDRAVRHDGWNRERIRTFLYALAECGVVSDAARAAGMSRQAAYDLRRRGHARAFHLAWEAAEQLGRRRLLGELLSRALNGCVEVIKRDGKVWRERIHYDNRLTLALLKRLEAQARSRLHGGATTGIIEQEFDRFVDIVSRGGKGATEFLADRQEMDAHRDGEIAILDRLDSGWWDSAANDRVQSLPEQGPAESPVFESANLPDDADPAAATANPGAAASAGPPPSGWVASD